MLISVKYVYINAFASSPHFVCILFCLTHHLFCPNRLHSQTNARKADGSSWLGHLSLYPPARACAWVPADSGRCDRY